MPEPKVGAEIKRKALKSVDGPDGIIVELQQLDQLYCSLQKNFPACLQIVQKLCKYPRSGNGHATKSKPVTPGFRYHSHTVVTVEYVAIAKYRD